MDGSNYQWLLAELIKTKPELNSKAKPELSKAKPELGTAQPQLVFHFVSHFNFLNLVAYSAVPPRLVDWSVDSYQCW